jgi:hypothetical protein
MNAILISIVRNILVHSALAASIFIGGTASAAPPANVAGVWTVTADGEYISIEVAQGSATLGPCPPISGYVDGFAQIHGFYCPDNGHLYFHQANFATDLTVRTFDGYVSAATTNQPAQFAGTMTVVNKRFAALGPYPFSATK